MRTPVSSRLPLLLVAALAMTAAAHARPTPSPAPGLILFSGLGFQGRQVAYTGARTQPVPPGFKARSAVSTGLWTLCDGRQATSRCQTVEGAAARLKLDPRMVRPGVDAIALYDKPGLRGRRVIYSFASDRPPPFRPRSARTWGGPWSLCPAHQGRCETVEGARASLDVDVAAIRPGRAPERLQIALAPSAPAPPSPASPPPRAKPTPAPAARIAHEPPPAALARNDREPPAAAPPSGPLASLPRALPRNAEPFAHRPPAPAEELAQAPPPQPAARQTGPVQVNYACDDGRSLIVVFDPRNETAEVLSRNEDPVVLDRMNARRGFRYESFDGAFYGERAQATYEDRDGELVDCRAVQPRGAYVEP